MFSAESPERDSAAHAQDHNYIITFTFENRGIISFDDYSYPRAESLIRRLGWEIE
jgi:hypothetical protein